MGQERRNKTWPGASGQGLNPLIRYSPYLLLINNIVLLYHKLIIHRKIVPKVKQSKVKHIFPWYSLGLFPIPVFYQLL